MAKRTTLGLIVANRGFFPDHLCRKGRKDVIDALEKQGFGVVALGEDDTKFGSVETRQDAAKCASLFRRNRNKIDGIVVSLPNFGDERGVADTLKMAGLNVPVLIQATPDKTGEMTIKDRRDSFCGKISVCNNLAQYGIKYTLTSLHTAAPKSECFEEDLADFGATCRVVRGLRNARIGAIGARPASFNTVRFSEKILESSGISVETIDLFEVFSNIDRMKKSDKSVQAKLKAIRSYMPCDNVDEKALTKMAKFGVFVDHWVKDMELDATAIQCWTAMEEFFGVVPCTVMSMMSDKLLPSACEVDVTGAVGMLAMRLASGTPSALLDWNNNYGDDPDKCVLFHCSNLPKSSFENACMDYQQIIAGTVGKDNTWGTCVGRIKTGPFTFCRVSTDDLGGRIRVYLGEGEFTDEPVDTFGGYGVAEIPDLQTLLSYICACGFEHHVAVNHSEIALPVYEALTNYMDWDVYYHE